MTRSQPTTGIEKPNHHERLTTAGFDVAAGGDELSWLVRKSSTVVCVPELRTGDDDLLHQRTASSCSIIAQIEIHLGAVAFSGIRL
jgi:hypothetical protein